MEENVKQKVVDNSFKKKAIKCVVVLLVISIIAGGLLAILNPLLAVSETETNGRMLKKIYGSVPEKFEVTYDISSASDEQKTLHSNTYGEIQKIFDVTINGKLEQVFVSTGNDGYKNGTMTLLVQICTNDSGDQYVKQAIYSGTNTSQTLTSSLTNSFYSAFTNATLSTRFAITEGTGITKNVVSGASKSSRAADNAVNCVLEYLGGIN